MRSGPDAGLAARLARDLAAEGEAPASSRIVERIWLEVVTGTLDSGQRLPTVRQLAVDLGVSPRVVERAYAQLQKLGVVIERRGEGTFVGLGPPPPGARERFLEMERLARTSVERAAELGFTIDDLIDLLADLRDGAPGGGEAPTESGRESS